MSYGYDGSGGGIDMGRLARYGLGVIIALVGFVMYMMKTERNPVTGENQHIGMSVPQERQLGLQAAPEMASKMGGDIDPSTDARARVVSEVGQEIVRRSDAARSPYADNFHFHLLDDPKTINAFALPGGQIFITKALYEKLDNEADLAGVLGHEIGHVIARHSAQQMAKGQLGQILTVAVGVGASGDNRGQQAGAAAAMANQMMQLRYGRGDESQADHYGLEYMAQAGYDPTGILRVMEILKQTAGEGRQPEILSSHPLPETRIVAIKEMIAQEYPQGIPSSLSSGRRLPQVRYSASRD